MEYIIYCNFHAKSHNRLAETSYQYNIVVKGTRIWVVLEWGYVARKQWCYTYVQSKKLKSFSELFLPYTFNTFMADRELYTEGVYFFTYLLTYTTIIFISVHACVCVSVISIWRYCLRWYRLCYNVYMIVKQKRQKAQWTEKKFSLCGSLGPPLNVSFIIIFIIVYVIPLFFHR